MSRRANGGVRRPRQEQVEEEDAEPLPLLPLLCVAQSFRGMCVSAHLCDAQGAALFPFVCLPPSVCRPFAGAQVYDMSLTHGERLRVMGCGMMDKRVRLLSLGTGCYFEPGRNRRACHKLMQGVVRRAAAKLKHSLAAAVGNKVGKYAEELCASGQCAASVVALKLAVDLGHLLSRALMANMMIEGREGVAKDRNGAFELVEEGARLGCHHCQGVMAECYRYGDGCVKDKARSLELARESSGKGSRYGQCMLGMLYRNGGRRVAQDNAQALALYRLAAAQNFDEAQRGLGLMYSLGNGVAQDHAEALRWYQLAAAQGHPYALFRVAECHEKGRGVRENNAEAIRWYRCAQAAGNPFSAIALRRLRA
jgi:TPR repeat protein